MTPRDRPDYPIEGEIDWDPNQVLYNVVRDLDLAHKRIEELESMFSKAFVPVMEMLSRKVGPVNLDLSALPRGSEVVK